MRKKKIRKSRTMIVCYRREHALDAGAHLDINAHCFFEVDGLVFLSPFSVFFGGVRDGCCGVDLRELAMGSSASVLEVLASGGCGETAVLVCVRGKEETIWGCDDFGT